MGKPKYDVPTASFPYKIKKRLNLMSVPRKYIIDTGEGMPAYTPRGIRKSAVSAMCTDRVTDAAWPYIRRFIIIKKMYKNQFSLERMDRIDRMIEATNATCYAKLANCAIDLKKSDAKDVKKKKGWSDSEWKKHLEYLNPLAIPKKDFKAQPPKKGKSMALEALLQRINQICFLPDFKIYRRPSQEDGYRDPTKVAPLALKYVPTDRVLKLAVPRVIPQPD